MGYCCSSVFFFSSRRRHTRSKRDWSSDVCSSDLFRQRRHEAQHVGGQTLEFVEGLATNVLSLMPSLSKMRLLRQWAGLCDMTPRSEERRVGKSGELGRAEVVNKMRSAGEYRRNKE